MTMSEVGRRNQMVDPVNGGDVGADGTLLSVAEIQQRFREERARRGLAAPTRTVSAGAGAGTGTVTTAPAPAPVTAAPAPAAPQVIVSKPAPSGPEPAAAASSAVAVEATAHLAGSPAAAPVASAGAGLDLSASWVRVLAGHGGAGASTVALAIADAAAGAGRPSHLIETAPASRSGLVGAASRELDVDATGAWRRGTRPNPTIAAQVTIDRRTEDTPPGGWPATDGTGHDALVIVDLGLVPGDALARAAGGPVVVTCRATIPGVRLTEQLLSRLDETGVAVALLLAGRRCPGEVTSSCGPRLSTLRAAGRVVTVPVDGHLAITGPTRAPLPKAVLAAGRELLGLLDSAHDRAASPTAHAALRSPQKGTSR